MVTGRVACDGDGRFWFRTVTPSPYFTVAAGGHLPVTTHVFVAGSPYLDSDAVFAVKQSLIRDFTVVDDPAKAAAYGVEAPFRQVDFGVVLQPAP